jgi:hypothetical protein
VQKNKPGHDCLQIFQDKITVPMERALRKKANLRRVVLGIGKPCEAYHEFCA